MMFAGLTDSELDQLSERVYRATMRLFDATMALLGQMAQTASWTPQYAELQCREAALMTAAREQGALHTELVAVVRERREAARRLAETADQSDEEWAAFLEASAIEEADRRDDPLKMEGR